MREYGKNGSKLINGLRSPKFKGSTRNASKSISSYSREMVSQHTPRKESKLNSTRRRSTVKFKIYD